MFGKVGRMRKFLCMDFRVIGPDVLDPDDKVDLEVLAWMPGYSLEYYMAVFFPWLDWELHEYVGEEEGAYEVAMHVLRVEISEVGKAALRLEEFYQSELPPFRPEREESQIAADWDDMYSDDDDP
jgi:hypothetical protein